MCTHVKKLNIPAMALALVVSVSALFLSACNTDSSLSRVTEETSSETITQVSGDETESSPDPLSSALHEQADLYMLELVKGDADNTAEVFGYKRAEVLFPTYEFDDTLYRFLFEDVEYYYGAYITSDNSDYTLDVICHFPDLQGSVQAVKDDFWFMYEATQEWMAAVVGNDRELEAEKLKELKIAILQEAITRIENGTYKEDYTVTGYFSFHDNGNGQWLCKAVPEFVTLCDQNYMYNLTWIAPTAEYDMIYHLGSYYVEAGVISQEDLTAALERKMEEFNAYMDSLSQPS